MPDVAIYHTGADLPDLALTWLDTAGALIDFSSGYTFVAKVGTRAGVTSFVKTTGITGAATDPNVTIAWSTSGELNALAPGIYTLQVTATRTADAKERILEGTLRIRSTLEP
ncbi:MAG: hypothetical protein LC798_03015 [Chloroflexi bacterium]|nr:hypothetical protein [Chloroflexota bacterium]